MNKKKIFIAVDTPKISRAKRIIRDTQTNKIKIGYKFGVEFFYSKDGRKFLSSLKNKIIFLDLKLNDIPNTIVSAMKSLKYLNIYNNQLTGEIPAGIGDLTNLTFLKLYNRELKSLVSSVQPGVSSLG